MDETLNELWYAKPWDTQDRKDEIEKHNEPILRNLSEVEKDMLQDVELVAYYKIIKEYVNETCSRMKIVKQLPALRLGNQKDILIALQNFVIEIHLLNNYNTYYNTLSKMDVMFDNFTPDFVVDGVPVEYKVFLGRPDIAKDQMVISEIKEKYGINTKIHIIYLSNMSDYPYLVPFSNTVSVWVKLLSKMSQYLNPQDALNFVYTQRLSMSTLLLEDSQEFIINNTDRKLREIQIDEVNGNTLVSEFIESFCGFKHEDFINKNFVKVSEIKDLIPEPSKNVGADSRTKFSRDLAKEKYGIPGKPSNLWLFPVHEKNVLVEEDEITEDFPEEFLEFRDILRAYKLIEEESLEVRKILVHIAVLSKECEPSEMKEVLLEYGIRSENREVAINSLKEIAKRYIDTASVKLGHNKSIRITKHGAIALLLKSKIFEKAISKKKKKENEKLARKRREKELHLDVNDTDKLEYTEDSDDMIWNLDDLLNFESEVKQEVESEYMIDKQTRYTIKEEDYFEDIDRLAEGVPDRHEKISVPEFKNAYHSGDINNLSNKLVEDSMSYIDRVLSNKYIKWTIMHQRFIQTMKINVPRSSTKYEGSKSIRLFECPWNNIRIIATPAPNERVSGTIAILWKHKLDGGYKQPYWIIESTIYEKDGFLYGVTKPFTINWEDSQSSMSTMWGLIATCAISLTFGCDLTASTLIPSFGWNMNRQLKYALDLLNYFDKMAYNKGSLGRFELSDKFELTLIKDVRTATLLSRMRKNYTQFAKQCWESIKKGSNCKGIIHYAYNVEITGWQSYTILGYLKQILSSADGADPSKLMGAFTVRDAKFEKWYLDSPFHPLRYDRYKHMTLKEFYDKIFTDNNTKWVHFAYHYTCIYSLSNMAVRALNEPTRLGKLETPENFRKMWQAPCLMETTSRSVNMLTEMKERFRKSSEKSEMMKKGKYTGITSAKNDNAVAIEQLNIKRILREGLTKEFGREIPKKMMRTDISDVQLSLQDLTLYEMVLYPKCVILTMQLKQQKDYGKRPFFVQLIYNRNAFKLWDNAARPILKHSSNPSDVIMAPGSEKFLIFQKNMAEISTQLDSMGISIDIAKFGDTYSVEAMEATLKSWLASKYLSTSEYNMLFYFKECLQRRIVCMPYQYIEALRRAGLNETDEQKLFDEGTLMRTQDGKYIIEFEQSLRLQDQDPRKKLWCSECTASMEVSKNHSYIRESGATLGVFNILWSTHSTLIVMFKKMILKNIFGSLLICNESHSDDSKVQTTLRIPNAKDFKDFRCTEMIRELVMLRNDMDDQTIRYNLIGDVVYIIVENNKVKTRYTSKDVGKFVLTISVTLGRMFSQRCSLAKVFFGMATEMLQVVCTSDQQIIVPLVRYSASICADLPNLSPASDLYSAIGRGYDVICNGGLMTTNGVMLILINMAVYDQYRIDPRDLCIDRVPEQLGLYWALPDTIMEHGYGANLGRLLYCSEKDELIKRRLMCSIHNPGIWHMKSRDMRSSATVKTKFDKSSARISESVKSMGFSSSDESDDIGRYDDPEGYLTVISELDESELATTSMKDFFISWNRQKKSAMNLNFMLDLCEDILESVSKKTGSLREKLSDSVERLGLSINLDSKSTTLAMIKRLDKYTRPAMTAEFKRQSPDSIWVARIGYMSRIIKNPFSKGVIEFLGLDNKTCKLFDVSVSLTSLISTEFEMPKVTNDCFNLLKERYADILLYLKSQKWQFSEITRTEHIADLKCFYQKLEKPKLLTVNKTDIMKALALLEDKARSPNENESRWVFILFPELMNSKGFIEIVDDVKRICERLNASTARDIRLLARLIVRMYSGNYFSAIIKTVGLFKPYQHMMKMYSFETELLGETSQIYLSRELEIDIRRDIKPFSRLFFILQVLSSLTGMKLQDFTIVLAKRELSIDTSELIQDIMRIEDWNITWSSCLFSCMLYISSLRNLYLNMRVINPSILKKYVNIIYDKYGQKYESDEYGCSERFGICMDTHMLPRIIIVAHENNVMEPGSPKLSIIIEWSKSSIFESARRVLNYSQFMIDITMPKRLRNIKFIGRLSEVVEKKYIENDLKKSIRFYLSFNGEIRSRDILTDIGSMYDIQIVKTSDFEDILNESNLGRRVGTGIIVNNYLGFEEYQLTPWQFDGIRSGATIMCNNRGEKLVLMSDIVVAVNYKKESMFRLYNEDNQEVEIDEGLTNWISLYFKIDLPMLSRNSRLGVVYIMRMMEIISGFDIQLIQLIEKFGHSINPYVFEKIQEKAAIDVSQTLSPSVNSIVLSLFHITLSNGYFKTIDTVLPFCSLGYMQVVIHFHKDNSRGLTGKSKWLFKNCIDRKEIDCISVLKLDQPGNYVIRIGLNSITSSKIDISEFINNKIRKRCEVKGFNLIIKRGQIKELQDSDVVKVVTMTDESSLFCHKLRQLLFKNRGMRNSQMQNLIAMCIGLPIMDKKWNKPIKQLDRVPTRIVRIPRGIIYDIIRSLPGIADYANYIDMAYALGSNESSAGYDVILLNSIRLNLEGNERQLFEEIIKTM